MFLSNNEKGESLSLKINGEIVNSCDIPVLQEASKQAINPTEKLSILADGHRGNI